MDDDVLNDAPLLQAWLAATSGERRPFTIPGHKGLAGSVSSALGTLLFSDIPLFGGLASVKDAPAALARAERRAAELWGAGWCRFVTGGSTQANQIAALALGPPGTTVLVGRSVHRSTLTGLVLAGLSPVWVPADSSGRLSVQELHRSLTEHPDAAALLLVDPGYQGTRSKLTTIVAACHESGVAVIVDQAWGAHFGFHPSLPPHALAAGADAMIISAHKTLPAYSQASLLLASGRLLDLARLDRAADALITTSPAGSILASIDASRALLASPGGRALLGRLVDLVSDARAQLRSSGLDADEADDPTKLVIRLPDHDGLAIERDLIAGGIPVELAEQDLIIPIVTLVDNAESVDALVSTLIESAAIHRKPRSAGPVVAPEPVTAMSPRAAFFAAHETVPAARSIGRISAELVAPYPPGVAVLVPGEVVTQDALDVLHDARSRGARIAYASHPELTTVQVVAEDSVGARR